MTTSSVCRAVTAAIAVPALLIVAPAIAMAAGSDATHATPIHQVVSHQVTVKPVAHQTPTAISSTAHTVALPTRRTTSTSTAASTSHATTAPARHQVEAAAAAAPKAATAAPATPPARETPRGGSPCGPDAYACVHWHATYHWHGEYHVLGNNVEAGNYWNAGAYAEWSPDHNAHGHYWNAGAHVNVSHYYGDSHHGDDD
ncbi:hypothetical protein [Kutzneria sp. NPDC051319]|uniref:hypothetical protein n=1 Tax=Kutzneria sp. NPDC051319 TaxID=3155047 RepID=UPI003421A4DD